MRVLFFSLLLFLQYPAFSQVQTPIIPSERLASFANSSAFGDIILFNDELYIVFREGTGHIPSRHEPYGDGTLRVMKMEPDESWSTVEKISRTGVDLRDPHFSITADHKLLVTCGGSYYDKGKLRQWHTYAIESENGKLWGPPVPVAGIPGSNWFFRLTWKDGIGYCAANICKTDVITKTVNVRERRLVVFKTTDGFNYEMVRELSVPNTLGPCEATLHFDSKGSWNMLIRGYSGPDFNASIAVADEGFRSIEYFPLEKKLHGANIIELEDGTKIVGTRELPDEREDGRTVTSFYRLNKDMSLKKIFEVPSSGDTSYPGFQIYKGQLFIMYYSGHESSETGHMSSIYLSKIPLNQLELLVNK